MKVLFIQLHRIGDIVMQAPIVSEVGKKYPEAEIHSIMNTQFVELSRSIVHYDKVFSFPRLEMQEALVQPEQSIFRSYTILEKILNDLNKENYDLVINLTHNSLSAQLCDMIGAQKKLGAYYEDAVLRFSSPWFQHIDIFSGETNKLFHLLDCMKSGLGLKDLSHFSLQVSEEALSSISHITNRNRNYILVQCFTSDPKKNFNLNVLAKSIKYFKQTNPDIDIYLVGAPFEEQRIDEFIINYLDKVEVTKYICKFDSLVALVSKASLLLSPDTSVKHIAAFTETPVLEVAVGSGNLYESGVYSENSIILVSKMSCYPCAHSSKCSTNYECSAEIPYEVIGSLMGRILEKDFISIKNIAIEYSDVLQIYRISFDSKACWDVINLSNAFNKSALLRELKRGSWSIMLNGDQYESVLPISTECVRLETKILSSLDMSDNIQLLRKLDFIDEELNQLESSVEKVIRNIDSFKTSIDNNEIFNVLESNIEDWLKAMGAPNLYVDSIWFTRFHEIFNSSNNFNKFRRIYSSIMEFKHHTRIQRRIAKTVCGELERAYHEKD